MSDTPIPHPPLATEDEWRKARISLLAKEKELTKQADRVRAERRRLPMVKVEKEYTFDTPEGKKSLRELFDDKTQLVIYHFMFAPDWTVGCDGCTSFIDALGDLTMLGDRNTRFVTISRAPLAKLEAFKAEHGWDVPWYSSQGSDFNYDFHVTLDDSVHPLEYNYRDKAELGRLNPGRDMTGEMPGLSVFFRIGDDIYHTYSAYARGLESVTDSYAILDVTPYGRQEDWEDSPAGWPQKPTYG